MQGVLDLTHKMVYLSRRHRAFGTSDAHAFQQFVAVELLARAVPFDDEGSGQDGSLISGEALPARLTLSAAANTSAGIVSSINDTRFVVLTVRTTHCLLLGILRPGEPILHPRLQRLALKNKPPYMGGMSTIDRISMPLIIAHLTE
ncbi:hypothetical protein SDC9_192207 [bioreactor metagenome]|uniref:Uncharacterized protein n=1 Tax=bioreactor metagenome TaxID=1076179 RepID=A0A645I1M5_9ZZZZ